MIIKKRYVSLLLILISISLIGTGFSSWTVAFNGYDYVYGNIGIDVEINDIIKGLYYITDSSYFFDYYLYDDEYHITSSSIGFKLAMYKDMFINNIDKTEDLYMYLILSYTHNGTSDFDMFSNGNSYIDVPTYVKVSHSKNEKYFNNSDEIITSYVSSNNVHTHYMQTKILAYSPDKPSLYSLSERYANDSPNIAYFNVDFNFNLNSSSLITSKTNFEKYLNLSFLFSFNIGETAL